MDQGLFGIIREGGFEKKESVSEPLGSILLESLDNFIMLGVGPLYNLIKDYRCRDIPQPHQKFSAASGISGRR